jgi:hypothetical protein
MRGKPAILTLVLLIMLTVLFTPILMITEVYIGLQKTFFDPHFITPYLENAFGEIRNPGVYRRVISLLIEPAVRTNLMRGNKALYELAVDAAVQTIRVRWIETETIRLVNEFLLLWRAKPVKYDFTLYLRGLKSSFAGNLSRRILALAQSGDEEWSYLREELDKIPQGHAHLPSIREEIEKSLKGIPDTVDLLSLLGEEAVANLKRIRSVYLLYSLFLIYILPVIFVFLFFRLSPLKTGFIFTGSSILLSGILILCFVHFGGSAAAGNAAARLMGNLPEGLVWLNDIVQSMLTDAFAKMRIISLITISIGVVPPLVAVIFLHRRPKS